MQSIVIDKPYIPVPPHRGKIWPALLSHYVPRLLRKKYGVTEVDCVHVDRLQNSLQAKRGILLAVGEAIEVPTERPRGSSDPLLGQVHDQLITVLGLKDVPAT